MANRPNFLFIITDQHRADHLGCYGNSVVRTPNIDRLAQNGTRFERFYVATPICMPNRATLMTGRMPSLHGARQNGIPLSLTATTFVDIMRAAGYNTALIGKCHLQSINGNPPVVGMPEADPDRRPPPKELSEADNSLGRHGRYDQELPSTWERELNFEPTLPYYGFDHVELAIGHGDKTVGHYARWLKARHPNPDSLRGPENQLPGNRYTAPQAWRTTHAGRALSDGIRRRAHDEVSGELCAHRPRPAVFPSMLVSRSAPSIHTAGTLLGYVRSGNDPVCRRRFIAGERALPPHLKSLYDERAQNKSNRDGQRTFAITEREAREAIALTYGMITMVDDAIGSILGWLKTLRLDEDTVVVFTSDHGDFMGDHQLLLKGALHYRGLVRVPFIWHDPSVDSRGDWSTRDFAAPSISPIRFSTAPLCKAQRHAGKQFTAGGTGREIRPRFACSSKNTSGAVTWG